MKRVMRLRKNGKFIPHYIGPYMIMIRVGGVSYELDLAPSLELFHLLFHVSMLNKFIGDHSLVLHVEEICVKDLLSHEKEPPTIINWQVQKLRSEEITSVNVLWKIQKSEDATWE